MPDIRNVMCNVCGHTEAERDGDAYYCLCCNSLVSAVVEDDEPNFTENNVAALVRRAPVAVKTEQLSQSQPLSQFWQTLETQENDVKAEPGGDARGPLTPADFPTVSTTLSEDDYYSEIRMRYVMGVQIMLHLQIKALVDEFNVSPIIVDLVEPIWFRFLASTEIFADDRAYEVIKESESQGEMKDVRPTPKHEAEPHNLLGKRSVIIWYNFVRKTIPLWYSLVISFLACHLAREPIVSTDIIKWTTEGKLPYFAAFVEIDEQIGPPTKACPISSSRMFRPTHAIAVQKIESLAASLANSIRLELPPVNFYAIASRYLRQLSLPVETILPHACRIYEWSMPSELWLSANEFRLPTYSFVLSILIVSIRILYNIHGFGKWEMSLSSDTKTRGNKSKKLDVFAGKDEEAESECDVDVKSDAECSQASSNLDAADILRVLHSKYKKLTDTSDHVKDLEKYLKYCNDVVFAEVEGSFEDHEEDKLMEDLWDFYQKKQEEHKACDTLSSSPSCSPSCSPRKRPRESSKIKSNTIKRPKTGNVSMGSHKERAIQGMKSNMEENRFCYIPPRSKVKRLDYLHYTRKKGDGAYVYAAHADYYILLRSCARVAQLDVRTMHAAVLTFERRLNWLEKNIDRCVKEAASYEACEFCNDDAVMKKVSEDDEMMESVDDPTNCFKQAGVDSLSPSLEI